MSLRVTVAIAAFVAGLAVAPSSVWADGAEQGGPAAASEARASKPAVRAVGVTVDLLPILLSASAGEVGASGQVWGGLDHFRLRAVAARIAFPRWLVGKDGFEHQTTLVGALLFDYVFGDHFDRWWIGTGIEAWFSTIGHERFAAERAAWSTPVWTLGGGYIWPVAGNVYVEPWAAGHVALLAPVPEIRGETFHPQRLNGEVSLKVGVFFDL